MNKVLLFMVFTILFSCTKKDDKPLAQKYLTFNSDSSNVYAIYLNDNLDTLYPNITYKVYDNDIIFFQRILKDYDTLSNAKYFNIKYSIGYYSGWSIYNYNYIETNQYILHVKDYY